MSDYKHTINLKGTTLRKDWIGFLPSRDKNPIPISDDELQRAFNLAMKELKTKREALNRLSVLLGISYDSLRKRIRIKKTPGRPPKIG
ncbi:MAG: hypothetical protein AB1606_07275 [Nitrospirota bacterium]